MYRFIGVYVEEKDNFQSGQFESKKEAEKAGKCFMKEHQALYFLEKLEGENWEPVMPSFPWER